MVYGINFADDKFRSSQKFNTMMAKKYGVDKVLEYSPLDIDAAFCKENGYILSNERGYGYWLWKPYIVKKTLEIISYDDYLLYTDSGACLVDDVQILIKAMNDQGCDIMVFCLHAKEKDYTKRDAFILMDCDRPEFYDTRQRCATYFLLRKTDDTIKFACEWLSYAKDRRIITNDPNVMGYPNYEGFIENRHDQTVFSLLTKKWGLRAFRDPGRFGLDMDYPDDVLEISPYLQVFDDHRYRYMPKTYFGYKYISRRHFEFIYKHFRKLYS